MEVWKLKACPKCQGALLIDADEYGRFFSCLNCGWAKDLSQGTQLPRSRTDDDTDRPGVADGCNISPSCFTCPLSDCLWEHPTARQAYIKDRQTLAVFNNYRHLGIAEAARAAAQQSQITERSVYRMLKRTTTKEEAA